MPTSFRAVARVVIAIAAGALAGTLVLAAAGHLRGPILLDMTAELPQRVASGFYPPERVGDLTFAWTSGRAELVLADLGRDRSWTCTARLRSARKVPPIPHLDVLVDGLPVISRDAPNNFEDLQFDLTRRSSRADTVITFAVAPTLVPGPQDPRPLGVQVDRIFCAPSDGGAVPSPCTARLSSAIVPAVFAGTAVLAGVPLGGALTIAIAAAAGQTVPLDSGIAAFTPFVGTMTTAGAVIAVATLLLLLAAGAMRRRRISPFAAAFTCAAGVILYLQLLGLLHPAKTPIDVFFQAHRFEAVLGGHYFFTQPMPGGVSFPYAIGLYLFAAPWARLTADHESLLRVVVCATDAVSYVLLFWIVLQSWRDRAAAAATLMLAFTLPIAFEVIGNANLTNEFGHAASNATLALAAALPVSRRLAPHAAGLTALCTLAFLAHVSTFALLAVMLLALAALQWVSGTPEARRAARLVVVVTIASAVLASVLYYGHFLDVYRDALRVRTGSAAAAAVQPAMPSVEVRGQTAASMPRRIVDALRSSATWFGWPLLVLAAAGAWRIVQERRRDSVTCVAGACAVAYLIFVGVAVMRVQPAYQRYTVEFVSRVVLTTSPGVLLLAGAGVSWGLSRGMLARAATAALIASAFIVADVAWVTWFTTP